jgi:sterol desaturase/sphingolipid hydroxylase (fatty acid hydroxylase superfamily)
MSAVWLTTPGVGIGTVACMQANSQPSGQVLASTAAATRPRRLWTSAAVIAFLAGVVVSYPAALAPVVVLLVVVVPCERLFPRRRQRFFRPGLGTDLAWGIAQPALKLAGVAVGAVIALASLAWLPALLLRPLVTSMPFWVRAAVAVVLFDALAYWGHRWSHEVGFLWRFHSVHHSSGQMDWISGVRVHPLDGIVVAPPMVFLLAAGFGAKITGVLAVIQMVTGLFLHANVRWRWRPLQRIVATPEFHHWHHSSEADALNTNYSAFLPIWDLLFGTYFMPGGGRRPEVYGTATPVPDGFFAQLSHPFRDLCDPALALRHPIAQLRRTRAALRRGATQIRDATRRRPAPGQR